MLMIVSMGRGAVFALIETDVDPCHLLVDHDEFLIMALSSSSSVSTGWPTRLS